MQLDLGVRIGFSQEVDFELRLNDEKGPILGRPGRSVYQAYALPQSRRVYVHGFLGKSQSWVQAGHFHRPLQMLSWGPSRLLILLSYFTYTDPCCTKVSR